MTLPSNEVPLLGGRTTPGVVRIADTVRRPSTPNSEFIRCPLRHLAAKGFEGAPAPLGTDKHGRDVFTYLEGAVPACLQAHDDETLRSAARLIRRFHDLGAELVAMPAARAAGIEVVCHNDLSPCNFVFRAGLPVALIDFDAAAPGSRAYDLGYAAWLWLDLGAPSAGVPEQRRRLAAFLAAYGPCDHAAVLDATLTRQAIVAAQGRRQGDAAMSEWASRYLHWTLRHRQPLAGR